MADVSFEIENRSFRIINNWKNYLEDLICPKEIKEMGEKELKNLKKKKKNRQECYADRKTKNGETENKIQADRKRWNVARNKLKKKKKYIYELMASTRCLLRHTHLAIW